MSIPQPSYLLVTPFLQGVFQQETLRQLVHTYTRHSRKPIIDPITGDDTVNDWNQPQYVYPPAVDNLPCYYAQISKAVIQSYGVMSKNVPVLYIPQGDILDRGDYVSNIRTLADPAHGVPSILLLDGPIEVEDTTPGAPTFSGAVLIQCSLRDIQLVPDAHP